jgi:hypothetical protein
VEWFRAPFGFDNPEAVKAARDYGYCDPCIQEALQDPSAGLSLWTSDTGFVYGTAYDTKKAFDSALARAEINDADAIEGLED